MDTETKTKTAALAVGGALNLYLVGVALGFVGIVFLAEPAAACTVDLGASCDGGSCVVNLGYCDGGSCAANIIANCYSGSCTLNVNGRCEGGTCEIVISAATNYDDEPVCGEGCSAFITTTDC